MTYIHAYFEDWSRGAGDRTRMAISTSCETVHADFVRLIAGPRPDAPLPVELVPDVLGVDVAGRHQETAIGSYAFLPLAGAGLGASLALHCWFWPTVPERNDPQTIWTLSARAAALSLVVVENQLQLRIVGETTPLATAAIHIQKLRWYSVAVLIERDRLVLDVRLKGGLSAKRADRIVASALPDGPVFELLHLATAAADDVGSPTSSFNGKIDRPQFFHSLGDVDLKRLHAGEPTEAPVRLCWDMTSDFTVQELKPTPSTVAIGRMFNHVERGVTGYNWDGSAESFLHAPNQYGALQFHEDRMIESGWGYDLEFDLPADLASGCYGVRLTGDGVEETYPLYVRGAETARADVLMLFPTNTYLAYGNEQMAEDFPLPSTIIPRELNLTDDDKAVIGGRDFGLSLYDTHSDGTPVRYSSRRRPLLNTKPNAPNWLTGSWRHFAVDLYTLEWLERGGIDHHIATDEDLDREGLGLLSRYRVLVTGSHPEYWSSRARGAVEAYLNDGGKLMYLGGDGFYWVTSIDPLRPWIVEVRRDNSSTRCWDAPCGERTHTTTREIGSTWRLRGLGPHTLVGVGFAAQGWSNGCGYRRSEASFSGVAARFFEGIDGEFFGDQGLVLGGAAGDEVDRYDMILGSPAHGQILASSTGLDDAYQLVIDEQLLTLPEQGGNARPDKVRSDIVYIPVEGGGEVFSVGSVSYAGAMAWNDFDNDVARLTSNVLAHFLAASDQAPPIQPLAELTGSD